MKTSVKPFRKVSIQLIRRGGIKNFISDTREQINPNVSLVASKLSSDHFSVSMS